MSLPTSLLTDMRVEINKLCLYGIFASDEIIFREKV